ncbi:MAG: hypothetical protein HC902_10970 [Calothrix sp. SM1_5_4]|nr:hypothetical protein [Calothrix sp. SM1_5_4]
MRTERVEKRRSLLSKPWLWLSPSLAHRMSPAALNAINLITSGSPPAWQSLEWRGLHFPNRLGIAGGVDKDARNVKAWWTMGAGFLEVGTITPQPQPGNTPPVVDRDTGHEALWNRLGFPSQGADRVKLRLTELKRPFPAPVFANIGKNASTPLESAHADYIELLRKLHGCVDGFVVNISSPNTKGLRDLLKPERLHGFCVRSWRNAWTPFCLSSVPTWRMRSWRGCSISRTTSISTVGS